MTIVGNGPHRGFRVKPQSIESITGVANQFRVLFGLNETTQFKPEKILESLSKYSVTLDIVGDGDPDLPFGVEACWIPDTVTLTVRESVYLAACRCEPRALFTIAHEFGHLALGHKRTFNRTTHDRCEIFEDSEWQANTFAAEFLMPVALIKKYQAFTAEAIAALFGVSMPAAETRLSKLKGKKRI
jgi:IrrE N-terminal-like domain